MGERGTSVDEDEHILVLVVEDEPGFQKALVLLFESSGYVVVCASNGLDGMAKLETCMPDLVISDYMMPHMDGLDLLAAIRNHARFASLPVILISAVDLRPESHPQLQPGAFLKKPFEWEVLRKTAESLLEAARSQGVGSV